MKSMRPFLRIVAVLTVVFIVGVVSLWVIAPSPCSNDSIGVIPSPDGSKKVIIFQRDCGATTGFSTQASILRAEEKLKNTSGNVFISDTNHGAAPSGPGGGPELHVAWQDVSTVAISYHPAVRVFKAEQKVGGVQFIYSEVQHAAQPGVQADVHEKP